MNKIFAIFIGMLLAFLAVFVLVPQAVSMLGYSGEAFLGGDLWRIVSFPLAHVSMAHLLENIVGLLIIVLLAYELELTALEFSLVFALSGIAVAFIGGLFVPYLVIVGSSLGIYSLFGALSFKPQDFVPKYLFLTVFGIIIFLNIAYNIYSGKEVVQPAYHAAGFAAGAVVFRLKSIRRKKRILQ